MLIVVDTSRILKNLGGEEMVHGFSAYGRLNILNKLASQEWDILVIGGGITGAGIALDASLRGLHVGLVEKADFGSGTSSRSTKLIHGGLRYLKRGELKLVQEVGRERAILHANAPHLVIPVPMLLPIYKGGSYGYWVSSMGLYIYDWLAGVKRKEHRKMLNQREVIKREPLLKKDGLKGGGLYYEYRTDDARLTLDIMKTAVQYGTKAVNYVEVTQFLYRAEQVIGIRVKDWLTGHVTDLYARKIVNAAGPWVDGIRKLDDSLRGKRLKLTKGVHLVVDHSKLPIQQSIYFDTPDGRMVFVIPRGKITYIGTTDTSYNSLVDQPRTTKQDRDYLIHAVNAMFPEVNLSPHDIQSHWAGLRPLIYIEGKNPSELSRKDEIFISNSGLITIAGGKLTGFRKMAEKIVDLVVNQIQSSVGRSLASCSTDKIVISGGERMNKNWKEGLIQRGQNRGINELTVREWIELYGTNILEIYERYDRIPKHTSERSLLAQLQYSIEEEMTVNAVDFLKLRTGWTYFHLSQAETKAECVLQLMADLLKWNTDEKHSQKKAVEQLFKQIHEFPDEVESL